MQVEERMAAPVIDKALGFARGVWRGLVPESARSAMRPLVTGVLERRAFAALSGLEPAFQPGPLVVSGFLSESKGISQAARLTLAGLRAAGLNPIAHDLRPALARGPGGAVLPVDKPGGVWLAHCNAPEAVAAFAAVSPASWRGRYRIGYWAYELPVAPASWARASRLFHEIWAPSQFVVDSLRRAGVTTPLILMPHPVSLAPHAAAPDRARFGVPQDAFCVLAMGDLNSSVTRKNLLGAIDIYRRTFPDPAGNTRLLVKALGGGAGAFAAMTAKIARDRPDILFISENLAGEDVLRLIASSDVLLSPHRSEGFGLTLAEAFLLGAPALATGWSGNMDFMETLPELLIAHSLTRVRDPSGVYANDKLEWAEPDVDDAARKLAALAASPDLRRNLADRGRRAVEAQALKWDRASLEQTGLSGLVER
jgi:glycosyltransferase involved in cell wall biosynthesis